MFRSNKFRVKTENLVAGMAVKIGFRWVYIHSIEPMYAHSYRRATISRLRSRRKGSFIEFFPAGATMRVARAIPASTSPEGKALIANVVKKMGTDPDVINTITGPIAGNVRQIGHVGTFVDNSVDDNNE